MSVKCGNRKAHGATPTHHANVADVRACFSQAGATISINQAEVNRRKAAKAELDRAAKAQLPGQVTVEEAIRETVADRAASQGRRNMARELAAENDPVNPDWDHRGNPLRAVVPPPAPRRSVHSPGAPVVTNGFYLHEGTVYKVRPAQADPTRSYAMELVPGDDGENGTWKFAKGAMAWLRASDKMTAEQAAEYGRTHGQCAMCGRLLTDPVSIAQGIGPVCITKL